MIEVIGLADLYGVDGDHDAIRERFRDLALEQGVDLTWTTTNQVVWSHEPGDVFPDIDLRELKEEACG
jgi:hypothetical protein